MLSVAQFEQAPGVRAASCIASCYRASEPPKISLLKNENRGSRLLEFLAERVGVGSASVPFLVPYIQYLKNKNRSGRAFNFIKINHEKFHFYAFLLAI
jgi:hypothetical protein